MKKFTATFAVVVLFGASGTSAQTTVPNAGMEVWNNIIVYEEPQYWASPNALVASLGLKVVEKSTDAFGGMYAAKLSSVFLPGFNITVPGAMSTGTLDISNPSNPTFRGGFSLNAPDAVAVIGYYKYAPVGGDSCLIYTIKTRWNSALGRRDTVAVSIFIGGPKSSYSFFVAPFFVLLPGVTADSANIIISTANDVLTAQPGSVLYIDNIDFTNDVGIAELNAGASLPLLLADDRGVNVPLPAGVHDGWLHVFSISGRLVHQQKVERPDVLLTTAALTPGQYFIVLRNRDGSQIPAARLVRLN